MTDLSRLLWRCRRGMRETDIILQKFLTQSYDTLSTSDKQLFETLLNQADLDILDWLTGKKQPATDGLKRIIARIQESGNIA